jgi:hypothetical protein
LRETSRERLVVQPNKLAFDAPGADDAILPVLQNVCERNSKNFANGRKTPNRDAVLSRLVLLQLLKRRPDRCRQFFLRQTALKPELPNIDGDLPVLVTDRTDRRTRFCRLAIRCCPENEYANRIETLGRTPRAVITLSTRDIEQRRHNSSTPQTLLRRRSFAQARLRWPSLDVGKLTRLG